LKALFFFLLGIIAGIIGLRWYQRSMDAAAASAVEMRDALALKIEEWHLTPEEIRAELARTGEIARTKAAAMGDRIGDARILAVIKAKYLIDDELSAMDISVSVDDGTVSLTGTVGSDALIGRAVGLALDTRGVTDVVARLEVKS